LSKSTFSLYEALQVYFLRYPDAPPKRAALWVFSKHHDIVDAQWYSNQEPVEVADRLMRQARIAKSRVRRYIRLRAEADAWAGSVKPKKGGKG
jgi:hypothetical protein